MKPLLAIDLGTSYLKGVSFLPQENKVRIFDFLGIPYNPYFSNDLEAKLEELISFFKNEKRTDFDSVILGLGEGLAKGVVKKINFARKRPRRPITKSEFREIIERLQKDSYQTVQNYLNKKIILVKAAIKNIVVDNWETLSPIGIPANTITLKIINFYLPFDFSKRIEKFFSKKRIKIFSVKYIPEDFPDTILDYFSPYEEKREKEKIFIDIGGENTQVYITKGDKIETIKDFSIGGEEFNRRIAEVLNIKKELFRELIKEIKLKTGKGFFSPPIERKIKEAIYYQYKLWEEELSSVLENFSIFPSYEKEFYSPLKPIRRLYLFGGGTDLFFFDEFRKKFTNPPYSFIIKRIGLNDFKHIRNEFLEESVSEKKDYFSYDGIRRNSGEKFSSSQAIVPISICFPNKER